jgi:membrane protease subunit (stomatin/prohibitin family)
MLSALKRQFRSVIEWEDPNPETLFWQWGENGDEIKDASRLIIGPGQGCIFVYEGEVKSMLLEAGMVSLETDNVPFINTLKKFMQFFESEQKVSIYYFRLTKILDQKWGTTSPIKYVDPTYKFPVALRAFGNYSYRIDNPREFFVNLVGGQSRFGVAQLHHVIGSRIVHPLSDYLAESKFSYNDIDANRDEIGAGMQAKLSQDFGQLGFAIIDFRIEGAQFDEETLTRINRIADVSAEAQAPQQAAHARDDLAPRLGKLKKLFDADLISQTEYDAKKAMILDEL